MKSYKVLDQQEFTMGEYSIVPIRSKDRFDIMKWRNEQMYHLRQNESLTNEKQDIYFNNVISKLFEQKKPDQILFSFLENDVCIGYGGLVHINWIDKNAEISFILETSIVDKDFDFHLSLFLKFIEGVSSKQLNFHKIFTYAFDVRPEIYPILEKNGFKKEAVFKEHCLINGMFLNVIIHSKFI